MSTIGLSDLLAVAMEAAYAGGRRSLAYFNTPLAVELKADQTPVTCADRDAEAVIRQRILHTYPTHSIVGEEGGIVEGDKRYRWIIDPIDGTKTFVRGVPFFGVLIGVEVDSRPAVGVIYLPAVDEMISAADGLGCRWNGRVARVSDVSDLSQAALLTTDVTTATARSGAYAALAGRTRFQRTWGDCYGYAMVATGRAEIMLDPHMNPWDCAPMLPILREAGGRFTTWSGQETIWGPDAVATNAALGEQVRAMLADHELRR